MKKNDLKCERAVVRLTVEIDSTRNQIHLFTDVLVTLICQKICLEVRPQKVQNEVHINARKPDFWQQDDVHRPLIHRDHCRVRLTVI